MGIKSSILKDSGSESSSRIGEGYCTNDNNKSIHTVVSKEWTITLISFKLRSKLQHLYEMKGIVLMSSNNQFQQLDLYNNMT